MNLPLNVLFLCTGNSCRSIIGEALAEHRGKGRLRGLSAGSQPTGAVNPNALAVLARHGIVPESPSSKTMNDLAGQKIDLVVSVCDAAAGEACPLWLDTTPRVHWGLPDPADVMGDEATVAAAFEATFVALAGRIAQLEALPLEQLDAERLVRAAARIHVDACLEEHG
jgi:arsenate reductase